MGMTVRQLYRAIDGNREYCFNIECATPLTAVELDKLRLVLADGFLAETVAEIPNLAGAGWRSLGRGSISLPPGRRIWSRSAGLSV